MSAPAADIVPPSPTTAVATGTARSVRPVRVNAGSRRVVLNCCPRPTSTSSSHCRRNWLRWLSRTGNSSMICCFGPAPKLYGKWLVTPPISEPRSASSACCILGTRNSNFIPMSTVSFPPADSRCDHRSLDSLAPTLLRSHCGTAARVSWQVRRRPEGCLRTPSTAPGRRTRTAHPSQVLRCLAASALPQRLDRLLQTTLRRTRVRPTVSRPLHPPRRHLQPSLGRVGRRSSHLPLARLRRPQSTETDDPVAR